MCNKIQIFDTDKKKKNLKNKKLKKKQTKKQHKVKRLHIRMTYSRASGIHQHILRNFNLKTIFAAEVINVHNNLSKLNQKL
jgi:hypothetical protein